MESVSYVEYDSVLDHSFLYKSKLNLIEYFGHAHISSSLPRFFGILYFVIVSIQVMGPALLVCAQDMWDIDSLFTGLLKQISFFWSGPFTSNGEQRVKFALILIIIQITLNFTILFRSYIFSRNKYLMPYEGPLVVGLYKIFLVSTLPLSMSAVPYSVLLGRTSDSILFTMVTYFAPIAFVWSVYEYHNYAAPRVILEDYPIHEWLPLLGTLSTTTVTILSTLSTMVGAFPEHRLYYSIGVAFFSFIAGGGTFSLAATVNGKSSVLIGSFGITAMFISILQTINLKNKLFDTSYLVFAYPIFIILLHTLFTAIRRKRIAGLHSFFDECLMHPEDLNDLMMNRFKGGYHFVSNIRPSIEFWHPFISSFIPFEFAVQAWPKSPYVFILYGRILSFFPNMTEKLIWISNCISDIKDFPGGYSYVIQLRYIASSRSRGYSKSLEPILKAIDLRINTLTAKLTQFWDCVLQKDISNLWVDFLNLKSRLSSIDGHFQHIIHNYPINISVYRKYLSFNERFVHDPFIMNTIIDKIHSISSSDYWRIDPAIQSAVRVFPAVSSIISSSVEENNSGNEEETDEEPENIISPSLSKIAIQEAINGSPIGSIFKFLFLISSMMIVLIVIAIYTFIDLKNAVILPQKSLCDLIYAINDFQNLYSRLTAQFSFWISGLNNTITPELVFSNGANILLNNNQIEVRIINSTLIMDSLSKSQTALSNLIFSVNSAIDYFSNLSEVVNLISYNPIRDGMTFQSIVNQHFLLIQDNIANNGNIDFQKLIVSHEDSLLCHNILDSASNNVLKYQYNHNSPLFLNFRDGVIWIILFLLFFIVLPYILNSYQLGLEKNAIAESLIRFPGEEIRKILSSYGKNGVVEDNKASSITKAAKSQNGDENSIEHSLFYSLFLPVIIVLMIVLFQLQAYLVNNFRNPDSINHLHKASSYINQGFLYVSQLFFMDATNQSMFGINRTNLFSRTDLAFCFAENLSQKALLIDSSIVYDYVSTPDNTEIHNLIPLDDMSQNESLFERMVSLNYLDSISILYSSFCDFMRHSADNIITNMSDIFLTSYIYETDSIAYERETYFHNSIYQSSMKDTNSMILLITYTIVFVTVYQLFIWIILVSRLVSQQNLLKSALSLFQYVNNDVLSMNESATKIILNGDITMNDIIRFNKASKILEMIDTGIAILNTDMVLVSYNNKFQELFGKDSSIPLGQKVYDVFPSSIEMDTLFAKIVEMVTSNSLERVSRQIAIFNPNENKDRFYIVEPVYLSDVGPIDIDYSCQKVHHIVLSIVDNTFTVRNATLIKREQERLFDLLKNAIPYQIVEKIIGGENSHSFVVQSSTIAAIRVLVKDNGFSPSEQLQKLNQVFEIISHQLNDKEDVVKLRTFSRTFTLISGLFSKSSRSEKHASDMVHFIVKLFSNAKSLFAPVGTDVSLTVGIHTGGPIIAGVMNLKRPQFQVISEVVETTNQLKARAKEGSILISRRVYELIYSMGFKIIDNGEIKIKGNKNLESYQIEY